MTSGSLLVLALNVAMQIGVPGPFESPNFPPLANAYGQYGFEGQFEQRHPFDTQQNWVHGYFQEIPAYGGHVFFRPYNYKDVLSQSQTAAGWGLSPTMPYSQQFWHRYHEQATMLKLSRSLPAMGTPVVQPAGSWSTATSYTTPPWPTGSPAANAPFGSWQPASAMPSAQPWATSFPPAGNSAGPLLRPQ